MKAALQNRLPFLTLAIAILILDRWTKWLIDTKLSLNQTIAVIDGFFNITYVPNTGIAFGILNSVSSPGKTAILSILVAGTAAGVVFYSLRNPPEHRLFQVALSLIFAGALGNLYDRVRYGYVIDFLEFYIGDYRWPSFNVADSAISTGVFLLALEILRGDSTSKAPSRT